MAKYRTLDNVTFVWDGVVTSVAKNRELILTDEQVATVNGPIVLIEPDSSVFPDGAPMIEPVIVRTVPATPVAGEPVITAKPKPAPRGK